MIERMRNRLKFHVEQLLMRGAHFRLLFIAGVICLVSVVAGGLVLQVSGGFTGPAEAVWWAFLRLTDPGYLGDDQGVARRVIATAVTVIGYVVFMGALIAILTQWLNQTIADLGRGQTAIVENDHILIVGWTNRTASIVRELLVSEERVRRFLRRHGARRLRVVILAEESGLELAQELRDRLGELWDASRVILRAGSPLRIEHLRRVDYTHAAAILIPAGEFTGAGPAAIDARTVKTLLSMSRHSREEDVEELPLIVAEVVDQHRVDVARQSYAGRLEVLAGDAFVSRLIAQNVRHPGLSHVYGVLLVYDEGEEVYIRECPELTGRPFGELAASFPSAIPIGLVRPDRKSFEPLLVPPSGTVLQEGDRLVLVSASHALSASRAAPHAPAVLPGVVAGAPSAAAAHLSMVERRILVLGWSHRVPALLAELSGYASESFAVTVLSSVPLASRSALLERAEGGGTLQLEQLEGDYTVLPILRRVEPSRFDSVVLVASERVETGDEADARTILAYLLLRELLEDAGRRPHLVVELMDPGNVSLFEEGEAEMLVTPVVLSHMLAQVALRRELRAVFDVLFGPGGEEIFLQPAGDYGVCEREVTFAELQAAVSERGDIALGVRLAAEARQPGGGVHLNPDRSRRWRLRSEDQLVVLTKY